MSDFKEKIKSAAKNIGIDLIGFTVPEISQPYKNNFLNWIKNQYYGDMQYLPTTYKKRINPAEILSNTQTVIVIGVNYNSDMPYSIDFESRFNGWISRYAWSKDYHIILSEKIKLLIKFIKEIVKKDFNFKFYVDTGPILEKILAYQAGLGWIGKNTCLINQRYGSWIFIGCIFVDIYIPQDISEKNLCGSCQRCIKSCPTNAIVEPFIVDARRCVSYLTIELKTVPDEVLMEKMKNNIFGCDICQDVCPWNRKKFLNDFWNPSPDYFAPDLYRFLDFIENNFPEKFKNSPLKRAKKLGLIRNTIIAMANSLNKTEHKKLKDVILQLKNKYKREKISPLFDWTENIL